MSSKPNRNCFGFIIQTNKYSGNFQREFCAYLTGRIGECGVGGELIDKEADYSLFQDSVIDMPDDHGCYRPASIWPSPDKSYNSVIIYFDKCPTDEQIAFMKDKADNFNKYFRQNSRMGEYHKDIKILGYSIEQFTFTSKNRKI